MVKKIETRNEAAQIRWGSSSESQIGVSARKRQSFRVTHQYAEPQKEAAYRLLQHTRAYFYSQTETDGRNAANSTVASNPGR